MSPARYGATALGEAVKLEDIELVRMLLDAGANVNSPNQRQPDRADAGRQHRLAADREAAGRARRGRERGGNLPRPERADVGGGGNQPDIVDLLLAHGAKNVNLRAKYDDWPRQQTSEPRAQYQSRQTGGLTALLYATRSGCHALCRVTGEGGRRRQQAQP